MDIPFTAYPYLCSDESDHLWAIAGDFQSLPSVVRIDSQTGDYDIRNCPLVLDIDKDYFSTPKGIEFPTGNSAIAHALYYPVSNPAYQGLREERPPLIVQCHGGPTDAARSHLQLDIQFWTSRGFAVVDVNYSGSSGYGRAYRSRINGRWGEVDVEDCINAALYLVQMGEVDGERLIIRGRSAGGFTALNAVTRSNVFHAAAIYSGISDLKALLQMSLKFESHYLHTLIGPSESLEDALDDRSPIHRISKVSCPVILFQGLRDPIVPPPQAQLIAEALHAKQMPYAYLTFPDEGHSFRNSDTIQRCMGAELSFYSQVFGIELREKIAPVKIENMEV
jgi:dipeptidyl aminopeptidase/acylaminoacyl peptidase